MVLRDICFECVHLRRALHLSFCSLSKEYEIVTTTADVDEAETKENVWIALEGKKGRSKEFVMENTSKKKRFLRYVGLEIGSVNRTELALKN